MFKVYQAYWTLALCDVDFYTMKYYMKTFQENEVTSGLSPEELQEQKDAAEAESREYIGQFDPLQTQAYCMTVQAMVTLAVPH
jgi:hypothetical protein